MQRGKRPGDAVRVLQYVPFAALGPGGSAPDTRAERPEGGPDARLGRLRGGAALEGRLEDHAAAAGARECRDGLDAGGGPGASGGLLGEDLEGIVAGDGDVGRRVGVGLDFVVAVVGTGLFDDPVVGVGEGARGAGEGVRPGERVAGNCGRGHGSM